MATKKELDAAYTTINNLVRRDFNANASIRHLKKDLKEAQTLINSVMKWLKEDGYYYVGDKPYINFVARADKIERKRKSK